MFFQVQSGQQICLLLKKEELGCASKGTITLVLDLIYNKVRSYPHMLFFGVLVLNFQIWNELWFVSLSQVRAGIKTFKPKETNLTEESAKFSKKVSL